MNRYFLPLLQQANIWLLAFATMSILFFFFAMKVRFAKYPSVKSYALFFYAFIFYSIAAISFVLLNAMNNFLNLNDGFYSEVWWFFPFGILSSLVGYACAWIIHAAALKIAEPYTYKLLNSSLIIISFALIFTLLVQPMQLTFERVLSYNAPPPKPKEVNQINLEELYIDSIINPSMAMPSEVFDSLQLKYLNEKIKVLNPTNGYSFNAPLLIHPITQMYVLPIHRFKYLALLALAPRIQNQSELLLIDSMGNCLFNRSFTSYYNQISLSETGSLLQLNTLTLEDSVVVGLTFQLK